MGYRRDLQGIPDHPIKYRIREAGQADAPDPGGMHETPCLGTFKRQEQRMFEFSDQGTAQSGLPLFVEANGFQVLGLRTW